NAALVVLSYELTPPTQKRQRETFPYSGNPLRRTFVLPFNPSFLANAAEMSIPALFVLRPRRSVPHSAYSLLLLSQYESFKLRSERVCPPFQGPASPTSTVTVLSPTSSSIFLPLRFSSGSATKRSVLVSLP